MEKSTIINTPINWMDWLNKNSMKANSMIYFHCCCSFIVKYFSFSFSIVLCLISLCYFLPKRHLSSPLQKDFFFRWIGLQIRIISIHALERTHKRKKREKKRTTIHTAVQIKANIYIFVQFDGIYLYRTEILWYAMWTN